MSMLTTTLKPLKRRLGDYRKEVLQRFDLAYVRALAELVHNDLSFFHDFVPPPIGGAHQFLRGLWDEFSRMGFCMENNTISHTTFACLFNSHNFNSSRLERLRRSKCLMAHRIDGPSSFWRGKELDNKIFSLNQKFADITIFQSQYSLQMHLEMGLKMKEPYHIIKNAADPRLFNKTGRVPFSPDRKIRLISTSWSANPHKGRDVYQWLDKNLDWDIYEYTFLGQVESAFKNIRIIPPVPTDKVAELLKKHDIYVTASRDEPCSNSLVEALACGLPAIYLISGSHPEIVQEGGLGFKQPDEIPALAEKIINKYFFYQDHISIPTLGEVASLYLGAMGRHAGHNPSALVAARKDDYK